MSRCRRGALRLLEKGHCRRDQVLSRCRTSTVDARVRATSLMTPMGLATEAHGATLVPARTERFATMLVLSGTAKAVAARRNLVE